MWAGPGEEELGLGYNGVRAFLGTLAGVEERLYNHAYQPIALTEEFDEGELKRALRGGQDAK